MASLGDARGADPRGSVLVDALEQRADRPWLAIERPPDRASVTSATLGTQTSGQVAH